MLDRPHRPVRSVLVWDLLTQAIDRHARGNRRQGLDVVDAGGGTGGYAVPLAEQGHRVTVVDPSPDALAALERRAAEAGVSEGVVALQGDAAGLLDVVPEQSADVVLCHGVLEYVDDPQAAVAAAASVLRPGGMASLLVAQRLAVVLARALAGHFADAQQALTDPYGRWGAADPVPRRFEQGELAQLVAGSGMRIVEVAGVRVFADLVPGLLIDADPAAVEALRELEHVVATHPTLGQIAAQLHVVAVRD